MAKRYANYAMKCPKCGEECDRESVDVGVGMMYGPWGCFGCGWSESEEYDSSEGRSKANKEDTARYTTPTGVGIHKQRMAEKLEHLGLKDGQGIIDEVFGPSKEEDDGI